MKYLNLVLEIVGMLFKLYKLAKEWKDPRKHGRRD
jgi:hypothetical protein